MHSKFSLYDLGAVHRASCQQGLPVPVQPCRSLYDLGEVARAERALDKQAARKPTAPSSLYDLGAMPRHTRS